MILQDYLRDYEITRFRDFETKKSTCAMALWHWLEWRPWICYYLFDNLSKYLGLYTHFRININTQLPVKSRSDNLLIETFEYHYLCISHTQKKIQFGVMNNQLGLSIY